MTVARYVRRAAAAIMMVAWAGGAVLAQEARPFEPVVGQPGKDVVWVPSPPEMVELMLDTARVTDKDYVIDLGSGDGRNVIAAARRGATALGVEYNPDMVALSRRLAAEAGVSDKATFVEGDMFAADISKADVMALFLLPSNMLQLRSKFLDLKPGARIVSNTFGIEGWSPDFSDARPDCSAWCTVHLWIVPAKVAGSWALPQGPLTLTQEFQVLTGALAGTPIADAKMNGAEITFTVGATRYTGRVDGDTMQGTTNTGATWTARRAN